MRIADFVDVLGDKEGGVLAEYQETWSAPLSILSFVNVLTGNGYMVPNSLPILLIFSYSIPNKRETVCGFFKL